MDVRHLVLRLAASAEGADRLALRDRGSGRDHDGVEVQERQR